MKAKQAVNKYLFWIDGGSFGARVVSLITNNEWIFIDLGQLSSMNVN